MSLAGGVATTEEADSALSGASWIPVIQPHLSPVLVGPEQLERVRSVARYLPEDALYALEIRLASESKQVDLSVRINDPEVAGRLAAHLLPGHRRRFLEYWATQASTDGSAISELWLEFDLADLSASALPEPVLCVRLPNQLSTEWLLEEVLPQLHGRLPSEDLTRLVQRCLKELPRDSRILYLFDLSARSSQAIRIEIYGEELSSLIAYLRRVFSNKTAQQVSAIAPLLSDGERYHLSLDFEETAVAPRIGIEISYSRLPHREPRWRALLKRLEEANLCHLGEMDAIMTWPGYDAAGCGGNWPEGIAGYCVRSLSHVKLLTWPGDSPQAKVYLLFQHLQRRAS